MATFRRSLTSDGKFTMYLRIVVVMRKYSMWYALAQWLGDLRLAAILRVSGLIPAYTDPSSTDYAPQIL